MYKSRYKLLFFVCLVLGGQIALADINASKYYADHTREFLGYLGYKNPSAVPIRKISKDSPSCKLWGYTNGFAIYLNEDKFALRSEGLNLYVCAHEAAHYVLGHAYQAGNRNRVEMEQEADITAAHMLCNYGYRWVVEQQVSMLRRLINAGRGDWSDGKHPTNQQEYVYLNEILEMSL